MELDAYREWLHISDAARPPNHYELLELEPFEADPQRIQAAYGQRMTVVRRYQVGAHMEIAQRLISELSEAYVCLSDERRKQAYDTALRGGETMDRQMLTTVADVPAPAPAPPPVQPQPRMPVLRTPVPVAAAPKPSGAGSIRKRHPSPTVPIACGAGALLLVGLLVWMFSSSPAEIKPAPQAVESSAATPVDPPVGPAEPVPATPPKTIDREQMLAQLLEQKPAAGVDAHFFALLEGFAAERVNVAPRNDASTKVVIVFPHPIEPTLASRGFRTGDLVEIVGKTLANDEAGVALRVEGQAIQQADQPQSRIRAEDLPAPTPSAPPPQVASAPKASATPPKKPPATPSAPPAPSKPALPADWDQQVADAEAAWKRLQGGAPAYLPRTRLRLAGTFVSLQDGDPVAVNLQLGTTPAAIEGPFTPGGLAFVRQLPRSEAVQLEVRVQDSKRAGERVELLWMARAGAAESECVPFRTPPSTMPLATIRPGVLQRPINDVAWSPDSAKLLICSQPTAIFDAATSQQVQTVVDAECQRGEWSEDGRYVAVRMDRFAVPINPLNPGGLAVFDTVNRAQVLALGISVQGPAMFAFSPKAPVLAAVHDVANQNAFAFGQRRTRITMVNFASGKQTTQLVEEFVGPARLAWKSDGSQMAWSVANTGIRVMRSGSRGRPSNVPFAGDVEDMAWVPGKNLLAFCGREGLTVADMSKKKPVLNLPGVVKLSQCSFDGEGRLAAVIMNQSIQVWPLDATPGPAWSQAPTPSRWQSLAWSPSAPLLAALGSDGELGVWDDQGQKLATLRGGLTAYSAGRVVWSPDGQRLAAFAQNNTVVVFDMSAF